MGGGRARLGVAFGQVRAPIAFGAGSPVSQLRYAHRACRASAGPSPVVCWGSWPAGQDNWPRRANERGGGGRSGLEACQPSIRRLAGFFARRRAGVYRLEAPHAPPGVGVGFLTPAPGSRRVRGAGLAPLPNGADIHHLGVGFPLLDTIGNNFDEAKSTKPSIHAGFAAIAL